MDTTLTTKESYTTLSPKDFSEAIKSSNVYLLDVRNSDEFSGAHIPGAHNLNVMESDFLDKAQKLLPKDKIIAVYCLGGKRSAIAAETLAKAGYKIYNLEGGIENWQSQDLPVTSM